MVSSSIFQNFSGEGLTEPPPQTPPPLFLGLRPRLMSYRPQFSGASRPRLGLRPYLSIGDLGLAPQNKFLDPPVIKVTVFKYFQTVAIYIVSKCFLFSLKCTKFVSVWGSAPDPAGGAYSAPPDPLAGFGWDREGCRRKIYWSNPPFQNPGYGPETVKEKEGNMIKSKIVGLCHYK